MSVPAVIRCDGDDCEAYIMTNRHNKRYKEVIRIYPHHLRHIMQNEEGWIQVGHKDYCKLCVAEMKNGNEG